MNVKEILKNLKEYLPTSEIEKTTVAGFESAAHTIEETGLDHNIVMAFESADIKDYQIQLARQAAVLATNPVKALKEMVNNSKEPKIVAGTEKISFDIPEYSEISPVVAGFEAFDGADVKPKVHFAIALTALGAAQDDGAELLFPMIPLDAFNSGATVTATITSVIKEFTRGVAGNPNKDKFQKTPLVKIANKPDEIDVDKNKLIPVVRTENSDKFVVGLKHTTTTPDGEEVETAPLAIGKEINILELGQTDAMLAKGAMDITDALDPHVKVNAIYYNLTGKDAEGNDKTETFKFDIEALGVAYTYSTTAHNKDIIINTDIRSLALNTSKTRTATGADSAILSNLPANYTVKVRIKLNGDGNTQAGDISLYANEVEVLAVYNPAGQEVKSGDDYNKIIEVMNTIKVVGYDVEAFLTNSNMRVKGLILSSDGYTAVYNVPFRTSYTIMLPVVSNGEDGDATQLEQNVGVARWKLTSAAYKTLTNFINFLRNSVDGADIKGISALFVEKYFIDESYYLPDLVDSIKSSERAEDVRDALINKVKVHMTNAFLNSNYGIALTAMKPGVKPTVIIVTDPVIGQFLFGEQGIPSDGLFDYKTAVTVNPLMRGKIIATFGIFGSTRNQKAEPLNFGQCFIAPDLVIPAVRTVNNSTRLETTVMQRYLHCVNLPILVNYNVTGIEEIIGRQPIEFKNV